MAMTPPLAHLLKMRGKMRLDREGYLTMQLIYYPGFIVVGRAAEFWTAAAMSAVGRARIPEACPPARSFRARRAGRLRGGDRGVRARSQIPDQPRQGGWGPRSLTGRLLAGIDDCRPRFQGCADKVGRAPASQGRAFVLRIEPRRFAPGLDPSGFNPSRNTAKPAAPAFITKAALPVAGDRRRADGRHEYVTAIRFARPLDELAGGLLRRTALRKLRLRCAAPLVSDRHPSHPPCPKPGRLNSSNPEPLSVLRPARPPRQSLRLVARRPLQPPTLVNVERAARGSRRASRAVTPSAAGSGPLSHPVLRSLSDEPVGPTAIPPTAPPSPE